MSNATITVPVEATCAINDCAMQATVAYIVTGDYGTDCIGAYCDRCAREWADEKSSHTAIAEVDHADE